MLGVAGGLRAPRRGGAAARPRRPRAGRLPRGDVVALAGTPSPSAPGSPCSPCFSAACSRRSAGRACAPAATMRHDARSGRGRARAARGPAVARRVAGRARGRDARRRRARRPQSRAARRGWSSASPPSTSSLLQVSLYADARLDARRPSHAGGGPGVDARIRDVPGVVPAHARAGAAVPRA